MSENQSVQSISSKGLFCIAILEGAFVMALELIGLRLLAPTFGESLVLWTIVLTTVVSSLAAGYFLGGHWASVLKEGVSKRLALVMVLVTIFVVVIPLEGSVVLNSFFIKPYGLGVALSAATLLIFPNILFGSIPPLVIELLSRNLGLSAGNVSGRVYGLSTLGGISATFLFGFFLIPSFGLTIPLLVCSLLFGMAAFVVLKSRFDKTLYGILGVFVVLSGLSIFTRGSYQENVVKYHSEGLLGQVMVADVKNQVSGNDERVLFVNRIGQTWIDRNTNQSRWNYTNFLYSAASIYPKGSKVLLLGLGGGTVSDGLSKKLGFDLDVVELDERIGQVARDYFQYSGRKIEIDDARHYLRTTRKKYDIVIFDVFRGEVAPSYLLTKEALEQLKDKVKEGGMVLINFNGFVTGEKGLAGRSVYNTLLRAGYFVNVVPTTGDEASRNCLYLASTSPLEIGKPRIYMGVDGVNKSSYDFLMSSEQISSIYDQPHYILTDNKPNLELLNLGAAQHWRDDYRTFFQEQIGEDVAPLFN